MGIQQVDRLAESQTAIIHQPVEQVTARIAFAVTAIAIRPDRKAVAPALVVKGAFVERRPSAANRCLPQILRDNLSQVLLCFQSCGVS